jgi:hypothetical protein
MDPIGFAHRIVPTFYSESPFEIAYGGKNGGIEE